MPTGLGIAWTVIVVVIAAFSAISGVVFVLIGWLGPKPRFHFPGQTIVITSPWATLFFSFGIYRKQVIIEPALKVLHVETRWFWFAKPRKRVEFDWIASVAYYYTDAAWLTGTGYRWAGHQEEDVYTIGVWLANGDLVPFFRFVGAGQWVNNSYWPDWTYGTEIIQASLTAGHAADTSQGFADRLGGILGKPVRVGSP